MSPTGLVTYLMSHRSQSGATGGGFSGFSLGLTGGSVTEVGTFGPSFLTAATGSLGVGSGVGLAVGGVGLAAVGLTATADPWRVAAMTPATPATHRTASVPTSTPLPPDFLGRMATPTL